MERRELIISGINKLISINSDLLGIISCGSFSRGDMDGYSDIDLYLFTKSHNRLLKKDYWQSFFGEIISFRPFKDFQEGVYKIKFVTEEGLMYDLTIVSSWKFKLIGRYLDLVTFFGTRLLPDKIAYILNRNLNTFYQTIKRGYQVHLDRIKIDETLRRAINHIEKIKKGKKELGVSKEEYESSSSFFWQSCYTASVKLLRGDYYYVILVYDHLIKKELIKMIEWNKCISSRFETDVYYNAYKIRLWGGEELNRVLPDTLIKADPKEMQLAILNMLKIYQRHTQVFTEHTGFSRNIQFESFVIDFINDNISKIDEQNS